MNLIEIFSIIIIHWIADFVLQSGWQAKNKSHDNFALLTHVAIYGFVWWFIGLFLFPYWTVMSFWGITIICHATTDYFTSRLNTKLWNKKDVHNFFVSVGFDQVLHYIQLFTTYWLLK